MRENLKKAIVFIFAGCSLALLSGCGGSGSVNTENGKPVVKFNLRSEGKTIDPQLQTSESSSKVDAMCMEGLVSFGKNSGEIIPGVAEKWDISKDGKNLTFHLRKDAKWSDGSPVTAHDFIFAIKRGLEPATAAQYAYLLYTIENAEKYNKGEIKDFSKVKIKAIDDYTLKITLHAGVPYFLQILAMPISFPLKESFYNNIKDQYALTAKSMLYNGPYVIRDWIPNGKYEFAKNPQYWNKDSIKIDRINFAMVDNYNTASNMYRSGELDMCLITGDQLPQFKGKKYLHSVDTGSVWYLQFNNKNKYFKNQKIRQAVALAINRQIFCDNIRKDGSIPARAYVTPGITGGIVDGKEISFRKRFGEEYFKFDLAKAKKLYAEGLKEIGAKGPAKVRLLLGTQDSARRDCQYIQQALFKNLGMDVQLEPSTFQGRLTKMAQEDYDFVYAGWSADFNDPVNVLDLWVTDGGNNRTGFSNKEYDKDIKIAKTSSDNNIRMNALANAEKILMKQMPITPLYFNVRSWLIRPWLKDVVIRTVGIEVSFNWAYIAETK